MDQPLITRKQFAAAIAVSLLSPMLRLLPNAPVHLAGRAAWLSAIPALGPLVLICLLMGAFRRYMRPGEGMGGLMLRWLGPVAGRAVLILYGAWLLFYAGFILRSGADRLVSTVYPSSGPWLFAAVLLILCALAALGPLRAAARTAVLLRPVLFAALAAVFLLSLSNVRPENLKPLTARDALPALAGACPFATVGAAGAYFSFLSGYVDPPKSAVRWLLGPLVLGLAAGGLICFEVVGVFGPGLAGALMYPFFVMIRDISLSDVLPRIEAVIIALWVLADFMLCVMLLRCAHEALRPVFGLPAPEGVPMRALGRGRWLLWLEAASVLVCSLAFTVPAREMAVWSDKIVPLVSDIFTYGGFTLLWLVSARRRKYERPTL